MSVPLAYVVVTLVWSTTPLGILWSSETVSPTMAVLLRMLIGTGLGIVWLVIFRIKLPLNRQALKLYHCSVIGVFGGMLFSYLAAQFIPSGMISLVFGLSPILSGLLSQKLLGEGRLTLIKKIAMFVAFTGLFIIFYEHLSLSNTSWKGSVFIFLAVFFFSLSGVLVKSVQIEINPAATTVGTLLLSLPLFTLVWWFSDGVVNTGAWSHKSLYAITYLAVFGSFIGFFAYYYVLQHLAASTVALITMITPVIALGLGHLLNDEAITANLVIGSFCVIVGLALYQSSLRHLFIKQLASLSSMQRLQVKLSKLK